MKKNSPSPSLEKRGVSKKNSLWPQRTGSKKRVLIALSGGIDSAVSAYLLIKQGFQVEGAFMKNWTSQEGLLKNECPWLEDRRDALRVAGFLGIKLHTLDFEKQYQNTVMKYFFTEYKAGRTPNPDVMCNKEIKFKLLYNWARQHKFDYLATGHYAQVCSAPIYRQSEEPINGHATLVRSKDEFKDQTYFIYNIKTEQLPHLLFPIGGMKKTEVRNLARKIKLPNAERKESMGLCFVGKIRLKDFLQQKIKAKTGNVVFLPPLTPPSKGGESAVPPLLTKGGEGKVVVPPLTKGRVGGVIGHHQGLHNYTIGQRQGIQVGGQGGPYFVLGKDLKTNTLLVTNDPKDPRLLVKEVQLHSVNWLTPPNPLFRKEGGRDSSPLKIRGDKGVILIGRYRHQGELVPLTIKFIKKDLYKIIFKKPQKAVVSGQSLVLYKGQECVGGGVIA